jgi:hypothetical protein
MAISSETEEIIAFYNQRISLDLAQISQIETLEVGIAVTTGIGSTHQIKVFGPNQLIENFDVPIESLDEEVVSINTQIRDLQQLVLDIGEQANSVGCGSTAWVAGLTTTIVNQDQARYRGYTYTAPNPFSPTDGTLTVGNAGIGTQDYINQVAIGSYFSPINVCSNPFLGCTSGECAGYATSITNITNQIQILQTERNDLIDKVNTLKASRSEFELQQYAYTQSKNKLNQRIQSTQQILEFLQDPANDEWL